MYIFTVICSACRFSRIDPEMHTLIQSKEEPYQWSLYVLSDLGRIVQSFSPQCRVEDFFNFMICMY